MKQWLGYDTGLTPGKKDTSEVAVQAQATYKRKWSKLEFRALREYEHGAWRNGLPTDASE